MSPHPKQFQFINFNHRLMTTQIELQMSSFKIQEFYVHNNPEAEAQRSYAHAALNYKTKSEHARNSFRLLPQGYCERKTLKMKKIFIGPQIKSAHNGYRDQMIRIIRIQHTISQLRSHTNRYSNLKLLRQDEPGRHDPIPMGNKVTYYPKISSLKKSSRTGSVPGLLQVVSPVQEMLRNPGVWQGWPGETIRPRSVRMGKSRYRKQCYHVRS